MAYQCDYCGKGRQTGHHIRHHRGVAGGRWKRKAQKTARDWLPNLHAVRVLEEGVIVRRRLCTKCLRRAERPKREKKEENLELVQDKKEAKKIKVIDTGKAVGDTKPGKLEVKDTKKKIKGKGASK